MRTTGKQCGLAATGGYQPSLRSPWLAAFEEVNEAYSTQVCSCCGAKPDSSPKGRTDLGIRHWICSECGAEHDRDINAAKNILAAGGHPRLDGGILALQGE